MIVALTVAVKETTVRTSEVSLKIVFNVLVALTLLLSDRPYPDTPWSSNNNNNSNNNDAPWRNNNRGGNNNFGGNNGNNNGFGGNNSFGGGGGGSSLFNDNFSAGK